MPLSANRARLWKSIVRNVQRIELMLPHAVVLHNIMTLAFHNVSHVLINVICAPKMDASTAEATESWSKTVIVPWGITMILILIYAPNVPFHAAPARQALHVTLASTIESKREKGAFAKLAITRRRSHIVSNASHSVECVQIFRSFVLSAVESEFCHLSANVRRGIMMIWGRAKGVTSPAKLAPLKDAYYVLPIG